MPQQTNMAASSECCLPCIAKATHIFFSKPFQHICVSLDVNFNESLTNDVVNFEQLGPAFYLHTMYPLYGDTRHNDKIRYNGRILFLLLKKHMFRIYLRIASLRRF